MPIVKSSSSSRSSRKSAAQKPLAKAKPRAKPARRQLQSAPPPAPSWWDGLSAERKLDVVGITLALTGLLVILGLASAERNRFLGGLFGFLAQVFGWGIYVLPLALLTVGLWLIFRKIERIPAISIQRLTGVGVLYLWLLAALHALVATPENAEAIALNGLGGGALGGLFQRLLWHGLGTGGALVALLAWLIIGLILTLDISIQESFAGLGPLLARLRSLFTAPVDASGSASSSGLPPITTHMRAAESSPADDGLTPLPQTAQPPVSAVAPGFAATTTTASVIQWTLPAVKETLDEGSAPTVNEEFIQQRARLIQDTLASFGAPAQVVQISRGPAITQFGVEPLFVESRSGRTRVRVSKIAALSDDLALALAAPRIRIQAPVPGRSYVGIEVPNEEMTVVALRDIVETETFQRDKKPLSFALGRGVAGHPIIADLEAMPHLLIAGTTGSGKSVCVNAILTCMLINNTPDDLRLVLVDPKRVELTNYNGIPHLLGPVVVEMERVIGAMQWMTREMDKRYHLFATVGARNIGDYNTRMKTQGAKKLPSLIIIIDELADLMMLAPDETERTITRLATLARATGIHMILATQRPSVDVVTGLIKANFPARIAFAVASNVDSRVILDQPGAERLLGRGDMLYQAPDAAAAIRLQGVFVSDHEIQKLVEYWRAQAGVASPYAVAGAPIDSLPPGIPLKQAPLWENEAKPEGDPLYDDAVDLIRREGRASVSMLQRRLRIGYTRAARLVDRMEDNSIVGPPDGPLGNRKVLDYGPTAPPADE
jgi:S-DNA-T family DNA segregation ATPase FtsK/SpoIIIE